MANKRLRSHPKTLCRIVPGIDPDGLMGGTSSPDDGSASPLLAVNAFACKALANGARFQFNEPINTLLAEDGRVTGVETAGGRCPMRPGGSPIVGWDASPAGLFHLTGMCGQGFMLGPGLGELAARMIAGGTTDQDQAAVDTFSPAREYTQMRETLN